MPFEFRSDQGVLRLVYVRDRWRLEFNGLQAGAWPSAEAAVRAIVRQVSGLAAWDALEGVEAASDLLDWTPTGDNL